LVLLDEPLGALDLKLRQHMQVELKRILTELTITTLYVTHDQSEALSMSDRIAVMRHGRVEQIGSSREIYDRPSSPYVAHFVGKVNFLRGVYHTSSVIALDSGGKTLKVNTEALGTRDKVVVAIRPEHVDVIAEPSEESNVLRGVVTRVEYQGNLVQLHIATEGDYELVVERQASLSSARVGQKVALRLPEDKLVVWPDSGEESVAVGRSRVQ